MSRVWAWARVLSGVAILAFVVWRLGTGPFLDGLKTINGWSLAAAAGIAVVTTVGSAWRWRLVARGLGISLPLRTAVAAYYRSQFLNTTLPGGVLGDVDRGVRNGRDAGDLSRGLRAVGWERLAGQLVQVALAVIVLITVPSPVRSALPTVLTVVAGSALVLVVLGRALPRRGTSPWARTLRTARADIRDGLLARPARSGIVLASVVVVAGHTATFLVAARTAGSTASLTRLLPLAMLVLLAMAVPTNLGGWGPREGVAAWVFGAAGLGAAQGLEVATVYGVLVCAASLPGAAVLVVTWLARGSRRGSQTAGSPSGSTPAAPNAVYQPVSVAA
jgi:glycosyltransferase 2 family protein